MSVMRDATFSGATILVIDDKEYNRVLLNDVLTGHGFRVAAVADGPAGLAWVAENSADAIVLDLSMPAMDGFDVLTRLRQEPATAFVPVLLLTAHYREPEMIARGFALGADGYLTKPFLMDELVARLTQTLRAADAARSAQARVRELQDALADDIRGALHAALVGLDALDGPARQAVAHVREHIAVAARRTDELLADRPSSTV